jgi:hypothetical protein
MTSALLLLVAVLGLLDHVNAYASMLRNFRCREPLRAGLHVMSYAAALSDKRSIVVRRAADNSIVPCDGSGRYAPGELLHVQLSAFDAADNVAYAEHLLELRSASLTAQFADGGCQGRRFAGQFHVTSAGVADQSLAVLHTHADDRATLAITAGWQRTLGPVQITATCYLAPVGAAAVDMSDIDAPAPSPAPATHDAGDL